MTNQYIWDICDVPPKIIERLESMPKYNRGKIFPKVEALWDFFNLANSGQTITMGNMFVKFSPEENNCGHGLMAYWERSSDQDIIYPVITALLNTFADMSTHRNTIYFSGTLREVMKLIKANQEDTISIVHVHPSNNDDYLIASAVWSCERGSGDTYGVSLEEVTKMLRTAHEKQLKELRSYF